MFEWFSIFAKTTQFVERFQYWQETCIDWWYWPDYFEVHGLFVSVWFQLIVVLVWLTSIILWMWFRCLKFRAILVTLDTGTTIVYFGTLDPTPVWFLSSHCDICFSLSSDVRLENVRTVVFAFVDSQSLGGSIHCTPCFSLSSGVWLENVFDSSFIVIELAYTIQLAGAAVDRCLNF